MQECPARRKRTVSSTALYRLSGLTLLLGAVLGTIGNILTDVLYSGNDPRQYLTPLWLVVTLVTLIGELLLVLGLSGIVVRQARRAGWLGLAGFVLMFIGEFLFTSYDVTALLVSPWLAQDAPQLLARNGPPSLFVFFLLAGILFSLGGILLGIGTMRARVLPRWAGLLLIIGVLLNVVDAPLSGTLGSVVGIVSFVFFALAVGWMGYALWTAKGEALSHPGLSGQAP
jgi:hypothetical protein